MLSTLLWTLLTIVAGYVFLVFLLYLLQSNLVYHPASELPYTPDLMGLNYEEVSFRSEDGKDLHGWFIPHEQARGTILFQHGNAGNISGRLETIQILHQLGLQVFIYDYRGYGKSEGTPTEQGTYKDAMGAWNFLTSEKNIPANRIILMGRSLGGAVTSWLANQVKPAGVILESTFTSAPDVAADLYPVFPVRRMIKFEYPNKQHIQSITEPILVAHSTGDDLIPFEHGKRLYELANEPKRFFEMQGDHGNGFLETGEAYRKVIDEFVSEVLENEKTNKQQ